MIEVWTWKNGDPNEWEKLPFSTYCKQRKQGDLAGRYFTELSSDPYDDGVALIIECTEESYKAYQRDFEHEKYLRREANKQLTQALSHLSGDDGEDDFLEVLSSDAASVEEIALDGVMRDALRDALKLLTATEREFIINYFDMERPSTRKLAEKYQLSQPSALRHSGKTKKVVID